jgi:hypothetical protein
MTEEPSFIRKIDWAEQHLVKIQGLIDTFADDHPYTVTHRFEGKRKKSRWRLEFTGSPDEDLPLILGDVLYNIRSGLDHLAGMLVQPSKRTKAFFPIVTESIWDIPEVEGENEERAKARRNWNSVTRTMRPEAVTILKAAQPIEPRPDPRAKHILSILNVLSNKDRHSKFNILVRGLAGEGITAELTTKDGSVFEGDPQGIGSRTGFQDGATLKVPPGVVKVDLQGTPLVLVRVAEDWGNIRIPHDLLPMFPWIRDRLFTPLMPYLQSRS